MAKKILLVYPEIPSTYWSFKYALPMIKRKASMPPLGLLTVASLIPDRYELKLIDMNVKELNIDDLEDCDLVFISAMIVQKDSMNKVIRMCRELGKTVVAGGPYPTSSYEEIDGVDHFVLNEAETTLPDFFRDYENNNPERIYTSDVKPDIMITPLPRYDLVENVYDYTYLALQYSRGCPYNCEFCDIIEMYGRKHRSKNVDQFLNEMQHVYNTGYRGTLFIVDDNFIGNKKAVKKLLTGILKWQEEQGFPFILLTEASIDLAQDDELLDLMFRSGFTSVFVGIETPDTSTLANTQKQQNLRNDILESVKKIQRAGLEVMGGFIVGFDSDPENIFDMQIDFIRDSGIPTAMVGILQAMPNTQLYRRLKSEGRLEKSTTGNNTHDMQLNFTPVMPRDKLIEGYKKIISEIYRPRAYYKRTMTLLNRLPVIRKGTKPLDARDIKIFFHSLFKMTFTSYGFLYLKYIFSIIIRKPKLFPLAANYAIRGYHFFRITDEILRKWEFSEVLDRYLKRISDKIKQYNFDNNILKAIEIIEKYRFMLKKKAMRYVRMNYNLHNLLDEKLAMIDSFCDSLISGYKQKFYLKSSEN